MLSSRVSFSVDVLPAHGRSQHPSGVFGIYATSAAVTLEGTALAGMTLSRNHAGAWEGTARDVGSNARVTLLTSVWGAREALAGGPGRSPEPPRVAGRVSSPPPSQ